LTASFRRFLALEAAPGVLLIAAAALAMIAANTGLAPHYEHLVATPLGVRFGNAALEKPLLLWVNEGLMAVFFLLVGIEIKRELAEGALASRARAALPVVAALAGMLVPAAIYIAINRADPSSLDGWAIPSATDIAFSLGVLALLGSRAPAALKVFLTAVAVFDDLGAIVVIAVFYATHLSPLALFLAAFPLAVLVALNRWGGARVASYMLAGIALWLCVVESGVHATLAGVAVALALPRDQAHEVERRLKPWVDIGILPLFAFANAGISLAGVGMAALTAPVTLGIALGLFLGKQIGVFGAAWALVRLGWARLPEGVTWAQLFGVSLLAGIGFTMSLFIGTLAFSDLARAVDVRLGVMLGSLVSAICGYLVLSWRSKPSG
jgi:NhaA family Na+:H+ antiporter